ncbi:hypothetical protein N665_0316s0002 [Sinapis alba]|nr:hypothetical protein N665_0316s0002 [Sinapis alba]
MCREPTRPVVGEEKQRTRTSKRKHVESTSMETTSTTSPSKFETSRTHTKKPKFLNLKLELNTSHEIDESLVTSTSKKKQSKTKGGDDTTTLKKKRVEEKEEEQYDTVAAYLFNSTTDSTISSIHDLLLTSSTADVDCGGGRNILSSPYDLHEEHGSTSSTSLLRTAMRKGASKEETTVERWVSYSEVVDEVVMSRSGTPRCCGDGKPLLALKLDYEQIMEAWPDKGTLYVDGEPPQTVPDLHDASADVFTGGGEAGSLWAVPEMETTERLWRGQREASLLRYKEKRQSRLFSKRIRYQVRKLNAEKRPRVKGRFVKRDDL